MVAIVKANIHGMQAAEASTLTASKVLYLMAALKASVDAAKKRKAGETLKKAGGKERRAAAG